MSQMTIAEFKRIVDSGLRARGLHRHKLSDFLTPVYAAEKTGDVVRYFGPHAMRRPWGCVMLGTFGVEVPVLREWLAANDAQSETAGLSYYMSNERQFLSPVVVVSETDLSALGHWFDAIYSRVISLPSKTESLAALADEQAKHLRLLHDSVPDFWDNFRAWQNHENTRPR